MYLCFFHTGKCDPVSGVISKIAHLDGYRQGLGEDPMDITNGLSRQGDLLCDRASILLDDLAVLVFLGDGAARLQKVIVELLDEVWG